jgi:hypothetical protein
MTMSKTNGDLIDQAIEQVLTRQRTPCALQQRPGPPPRLRLDRPPVPALDPGDEASPLPGVSRIETSEGPVWLSGSAVMCQCPQCEAPVSVRLWLMIADCWRCEAAIELGYEQQRAAAELARGTSGQAILNMPATPRRLLSAQRPAPLPPPRPVATADHPEHRRRRLVQVLRDGLSTFPAWLVSTLVHLIILLILAMIMLPQEFQLESITLSTAVSADDREGGIDFTAPPEDPLEFDAALPPRFRISEEELQPVRLAAAQDARELLLDPDPVSAPVELKTVIETVTQRNGPLYTLATRDPRLRNELVSREGGTTLSEAAVARGLRWLASVQNQDGSWSLSRYWDHDNPKNRGDAAATSLALLPFLGAGQTHEHGIYRENVARGLRWLIENQKSSGDLRFGISSDAGMYAHGQAAIVLVEALAMSGDERFRQPAQRAIDFIESAQHKDGGWRYQPGQPGDTSVLGWQLMALQAARNSRTGLVVDDATLKLAGHFLDSVSRNYRMREFRNIQPGMLYRYLPGDASPKPSMTAEAMLCRMYLGWKRDDPRMRLAMQWLLEHAAPSRDEKNIYYWYYATQSMHHFGGTAWNSWNEQLRDLLIVEQRRGGKYPGSWDPDDYEYGKSGGRVYVTALAVCTLEVYYRHLPLFKQLDLE